jgi:hypothetical protein
MVLVLETELSDGKGDKTVFVGLKTMPLHEQVEES